MSETITRKQIVERYKISFGQLERLIMSGEFPQCEFQIPAVGGTKHYDCKKVEDYFNGTKYEKSMSITEMAKDFLTQLVIGNNCAAKVQRAKYRKKLQMARDNPPERTIIRFDSDWKLG